MASESVPSTERRKEPKVPKPLTPVTRVDADSLETLKFALGAYDTANTHAMRLWYAAALISVPVLLHVAGLGDVPKVLDLDLNITTLLPALLLILSALNLIFIVAQVSHHRMADAYRSIVVELFAEDEMASRQLRWRDLALRAPIAGHNRIMPLLESFGMKSGWQSTRLLRFFFNLLFSLFPTVSLILGLWKLPYASPLFTAVNLSSALSIVAAMAVVQHAYRGFKKIGEQVI